MALTAYTTYATIRGLLGVNHLEVKDATLALANFELTFLMEMEDLDSGGGAVKVQYDTVTAIDPGTRTAQQQRFLDLFNLCAAYSVALQLLTSAPMFAPKSLQDGKASLTRFDNPFETLRLNVETSYNLLRTRLTTLLGLLDPTAGVTTTTRRFISAVGLASDPVTGV